MTWAPIFSTNCSSSKSRTCLLFYVFQLSSKVIKKSTSFRYTPSRSNASKCPGALSRSSRMDGPTCSPFNRWGENFIESLPTYFYIHSRIFLRKIRKESISGNYTSQIIRCRNYRARKLWLPLAFEHTIRDAIVCNDFINMFKFCQQFRVILINFSPLSFP